jgi:hypothetical protein
MCAFVSLSIAFDSFAAIAEIDAFTSQALEPDIEWARIACVRQEGSGSPGNPAGSETAVRSAAGRHDLPAANAVWFAQFGVSGSGSLLYCQGAWGRPNA